MRCAIAPPAWPAGGATPPSNNCLCVGRRLFTLSAAVVQIDATRFFIAEEFTPLFHTPAYAVLPQTVRLRYNQLHAFYFNEQVTFFEQEMLSPALRALAHAKLPQLLVEGVREFYRDEQRHTAAFRALNRQCAPEFYAHRDYFFVGISPGSRALVRTISGWPRLFPLLFWLALMQEERSLFYSKGCLDQAGQLEPHFVATHRAHLADEVGHISWDEELLDCLWPRATQFVRSANARLLNWLVGEFFLLPKRSGLRVVERLIQEFPQLDAEALRHAMAGLAGNDAYARTLYSRAITPRTFARFDRHPEFALLARTLPGYVPSRA